MADETVLADYSYDGLGRRVVFQDPVVGRTTRYYYDGQNVIEERDAADALVRYHVHGGQYVDERVASYDTGVGGLRAPGWTYYLLGHNFSVTGTGNADGSVIERLDYAATGDPAAPPSGYFFDADEDDDIDLADWTDSTNGFAACLLGPEVTANTNCLVHDFSRDQDVDFADGASFQRYFSGSGVEPSLATWQPSNSAECCHFRSTVHPWSTPSLMARRPLMFISCPLDVPPEDDVDGGNTP